MKILLAELFDTAGAIDDDFGFAFKFNIFPLITSMSLKCISGNRELFSFDFEGPEDWEGLRTRNRKEHVLKMSCCGSEVVLKTSKLGTQYFTHAKKGTCSSVPETAEVMLAKEVVAKAGRRAGWTVHVEASGQMHEGENWTVDVLVSRDSGAPVAFVIQWGHVSFEEMVRRQALYQSAGIRTMWLMRQHDIPVDKTVPAFRLSRDESTGKCSVSLPGTYFHPAFASAKNGNDSNHWRQHVELGQSQAMNDPKKRILDLDAAQAERALGISGKALRDLQAVA